MKTRMLSWVIVVGVTACTASAPPPPDDPPTGSNGAMSLAPPLVAAPSAVSGETLGLRGSSQGAAIVVVQTGGAANPVGLVLPDGNFCIDVPLAMGSNTLHLRALAQSKMSTETLVTVTRDPQSPTKAETCATPPSTMATCTGAGAACDPACNGCKEDAFAPNFRSNQAPALNMKSTYSLSLCPCRPQWFTFVMFPKQQVQITASYPTGNNFDVDLALFRGNDALPNFKESATPVATSANGTSGSNTTRTLAFTVTDGAAFYLRIAAPAGSLGTGNFTLTTQ